MTTTAEYTQYLPSRRLKPSEVLKTARTVPSIFEHAAKNYPERLFLRVVDGPSETYGDAWAATTKMARRFRRLGIKKQDKVLVMLPNGRDAIYSWLALNRLNATDVSINTGYRGMTLVHAMNLSKASIILIHSAYLKVLMQSAPELLFLGQIVLMDDGYVDEQNFKTGEIELIRYADIEESPEPIVSDAAPWDVGSIVYTSGTSGPAKGVLMPHGQITLLAQMSAIKTDLKHTDIFFCFYPMYHMAGKFMSVLASISAGATLVLDTGFRPEAWLDKIRRYSATVTAAHGPMLEMVFAQEPSAEDRNHNLRLIRTAPLPKRIAKDFESRFGVRCMEVWGMTEIGIPCWTDFDAPLMAGCSGRIEHDWYDVAVVDPETDALLDWGKEGEFVVRPKYPWTLMLGYLEQPTETLKAWRNLWFHTGDHGKIDADGYLYFVDRGNERIRRRAENISPADVEAAALLHPDITEAAAVGVPSGYEGDDDILVWLVLRPGVEYEPESLLRFFAQQLPHYMVPRYLCHTSCLPRTATGKIQRTVLKKTATSAQLWDRQTAQIRIRDLMQ